MEIKEYLNKLLDYGIKNALFEVKKIKEIPETCCKMSDLEVIDLDENPLEFISETFEFLAENSSDINKTVKAVINNDLSKINADYYNLKQPILLSCSDLDKYYNL